MPKPNEKLNPNAGDEDGAADGEQEDPETPEATPAEAGASAGADTPAGSDAVDESGVPWKNRFEEHKRKTNETITALTERLNSMEQAARKSDDTPSEDSYTKEQRELARKEAEDIFYRERFADGLMEKELDNLAEGDEYVKNYKSEIRAELRNLRPEYRAHAPTISNVANAVIGRNRKQIFSSSGGKKLSSVQSQTLTPKGQPDKSKVVLTVDELEFQEDKKLENFTDEEVREMYQTHLKRKEKGKKK